MARGCTRIATVTGPPDMTAAVDRLEGWRDALRKAGLSDERVVHGDFTVESGAQATRQLLEAHPDVEITGKVRSIWSTVQRLSWRNPTKVMKIDVELDKTDPRTMRPGMRFRGTVEIGRRKDAVLVPVNAVFPTPEGPVVYRETTMGHERRRVTIEGRNETSVAIASGVAVGDRVSRRRLDAEVDAAE